MTSTQHAIFDQMHQALFNLGAQSDLLCITGSFGDTLNDEEILEMLKDWNTDAELAQRESPRSEGAGRSKLV